MIHPDDLTLDLPLFVLLSFSFPPVVLCLLSPPSSLSFAMIRNLSSKSSSACALTTSYHRITHRLSSTPGHNHPLILPPYSMALAYIIRLNVHPPS
ncbi:hypothetical protein BDQ17DRAFT_895582 [Cyathus striatus]|nr:hypothetical protein BDQ17DRAFT_895582 [Cyathus striatus]